MALTDIVFGEGDEAGFLVQTGTGSYSGTLTDAVTNETMTTKVPLSGGAPSGSVIQVS